MILNNYTILFWLFINTIFIVYNDYNQNLFLENLFNKNKFLMDISLKKLKNLEEKIIEYHLSTEKLLLKDKLQEGTNYLSDSSYSIFEYISLAIICVGCLAIISVVGHRVFGWNFDSFFGGNDEQFPGSGTATATVSSIKNTLSNNNHLTLSSNVTSKIIRISRERLYALIPAHLEDFTLQDYARLTPKNIESVLGSHLLSNTSLRKAFIQDLIVKESEKRREIKMTFWTPDD